MSLNDQIVGWFSVGLAWKFCENLLRIYKDSMGRKSVTDRQTHKQPNTQMDISGIYIRMFQFQMLPFKIKKYDIARVRTNIWGSESTNIADTSATLKNKAKKQVVSYIYFKYRFTSKYTTFEHLNFN